MTYDADFYDLVTDESYCSARAVLPAVLRLLRARSVVDVGCGLAGWARVALDEGCDVRAVDANPPEEDLLVPPSMFERADLGDGYPCTDFDLAVCLEVGEHLPPGSAGALVEGLSTARWVLFSAAYPGQGGEGHVNEQPAEWWASLFGQHGRYGTMALRWACWDNEEVAHYYRSNMTLYGDPRSIASLGMTVGVGTTPHPYRLQEMEHMIEAAVDDLRAPMPLGGVRQEYDARPYDAKIAAALYRLGAGPSPWPSST